MGIQRYAFNLVIFSIVISLCLDSARAQVTTSLRGEVRDNQGGVIPAAEVELLRTDTGVGRKVMTTEDGAYQFSQVPPGAYTITVH
jgi:hypothetical protein